MALGSLGATIMPNRASYQNIDRIHIGEYSNPLTSVLITKQSNINFPWTVITRYSNGHGQQKNFTSKRRAFAFAASLSN